MPKVNVVNAARKDQGTCGKCGDPLPAGSSYRWWEFRYGGRFVRCMKAECSPKASDLTQSDKLGRLYSAREAIEDAINDFQAGEYGSLDEVDSGSIVQALSDAISEAREVADEYREAAEAMPATAEENEERADYAEAWADEMENTIGEIESMGPESDEDYDSVDDLVDVIVTAAEGGKDALEL